MAWGVAGKGVAWGVWRDDGKGGGSGDGTIVHLVAMFVIMGGVVVVVVVVQWRYYWW